MCINGWVKFWSALGREVEQHSWHFVMISHVIGQSKSSHELFSQLRASFYWPWRLELLAYHSGGCIDWADRLTSCPGSASDGADVQDWAWNGPGTLVETEVARLKICRTTWYVGADGNFNDGSTLWRNDARKTPRKSQRRLANFFCYACGAKDSVLKYTIAIGRYPVLISQITPSIQTDWGRMFWWLGQLPTWIGSGRRVKGDHLTAVIAKPWSVSDRRSA